MPLDGQFDEHLDLAVVLGAAAGLSLRRALRVVRGRLYKRPIGGSRRGRRPNRNRGFDMGAHAILRDYFGVGGQPPVYSELDFEKRFRMPRVVFQRLYAAVYNEPWWKRSVNATGRLQSHPIQKLVAALRVLGYGEAYDRPDEYCRLSRSTICEATRRLTDLIVDKWEPTYLRRPTEDELKHILARNAARGMPGCIGAIDCTHWQWIKCPKALAGQYHDRKGKRSVVIESVCDEDTYIWHFFIGAPGSYNDKNVLASSPLMLDVNAGLWPPRNLSYTLNGRTRRLLYYTADQGYPRYPIFAMPHPAPDTRKLLVYNRLQEAVRKDAERLYAVMPSRFNIVLRPARFTTVERMVNTGKTVAILHNMAIECTRAGFLAHQRMQAAPGGPEDGMGRQADGNASGRDGGRDEDAGGHGFFVNDGPRGPGVWGPPVPADDQGRDPSDHGGPELIYGSLRYTDGAECEAKDKDAHFDLMRDLSEHVWKDRGRFLSPYVCG